MLTRDPQGRALVAGRSLAAILDAVDATTPAYIYDLGAMANEARELIDGFSDQAHLVAYAVKANSAGSVVGALAAAGSGAEVGSHAELEVARRAGVSADKLLLSGMGKSVLAIDASIGMSDRGIRAIQIDSVDEIAKIAARARALGRPARVALRLNPGVMAETHEAIATGHDDAKFGIGLSDLPASWHELARAGDALKLVGLGGHVGSQLTRVDDFLRAADTILEVAKSQPGIELVDLGGGFGIDYGDGCPVRPRDFAHSAVTKVRACGLGHATIVVEPGRSLVGSHGLLVATVVAEKRSGKRRWLVLDAGMSDLLRPALYGARHRIEPVDALAPADAVRWRVVGPVCESSDDFGEFALGDPAPSRVLIRDAGAYGFTMASNYNGRPLPLEIFVHDDGRITKSTAGHAGSWIEQRVGA